MKSVITKKKCRELNTNIKKVEDVNREIAHGIMEVCFHYLGTPITKESGYNLPMCDWRNIENEILKEIKKTCSIDVYVLTDCGIRSVHYTKEPKNEWTAHGPSIFLDDTLNLKCCFEEKFILKEDMERLNMWIQKCLLGILDLTVIEERCKKDAEERIKAKKKIDILLQSIMEDS